MNGSAASRGGLEDRRQGQDERLRALGIEPARITIKRHISGCGESFQLLGGKKQIQEMNNKAYNKKYIIYINMGIIN